MFSPARKKLPQTDFYPGKWVYREGNELCSAWSLLLSPGTKSHDGGDGLCVRVGMPRQNAGSYACLRASSATSSQWALWGTGVGLADRTRGWVAFCANWWSHRSLWDSWGTSRYLCLSICIAPLSSKLVVRLFIFKDRYSRSVAQPSWLLLML